MILRDDGEDRVGCGPRCRLGGCWFLQDQFLLKRDFGKKNVGLEISIFGIHIELDFTGLVN